MKVYWFGPKVPTSRVEPLMLLAMIMIIEGTTILVREGRSPSLYRSVSYLACVCVDIVVVVNIESLFLLSLPFLVLLTLPLAVQARGRIYKKKEKKSEDVVQVMQYVMSVVHP